METRSIIAENTTSEARPLSSEWLISFKDPRLILEENWFVAALEVSSFLLLLLAFRHAKQRGPESTYLVLAAAFTTICFEMLPVFPLPGYLLWWYQQGVVNLVRQRLPLFVVCFYTLVHYLAHCLTERCNLPHWTRSFATSVSAVMIAFPGLWLAQPLMLIMFHMDDPVFQNRLLSVPYIQLLVLNLLFFHTSHLFQQNLAEIQPQDRNVFNFIKCSLQTGLVSAIYSIVEQYLLYLLFALTLHVNAGFSVLALLLILGCIAKKELECLKVKSVSFQGVFSPLKRQEWWALVAAFAFVSTLPLWLNVQNLKSTGDRLEIGPCHVTHSVSNTSPLEFERRRYVCPEDQLYFDFQCVPRPSLESALKEKTKHYTICGKPFREPVRIAKAMIAYSLVCLGLFYCTMLASFQYVYQEKKKSFHKEL